MYDFTRMLFKLINSPVKLQIAFDTILAGYKSQTCLVHLDEIIVFSNKEEVHLQNLEDVLTALRHAGVYLNLLECTFLTNKINYLGHIIMPGTLEVEEA